MDIFFNTPFYWEYFNGESEILTKEKFIIKIKLCQWFFEKLVKKTIYPHPGLTKAFFALASYCFSTINSKGNLPTGYKETPCTKGEVIFQAE